MQIETACIVCVFAEILVVNRMNKHVDKRNLDSKYYLHQFEINEVLKNLIRPLCSRPDIVAPAILLCQHFNLSAMISFQKKSLKHIFEVILK